MFIALAGASASIASAQEEPTHLPTLQAEQTMARFSRCIVRTANQRALQHFLRAVPDGQAFQIAGRRLTREYCVPRVPGATSQLRFRPDLLRSALYSALYRRDFAASTPPDVAAIPPLLFSSEFDAPAAEIPAVTRVLRGLGDCAARADSRSAHILLVTEVGSSEERAAMNAVLPAVQHCLEEGNELRFGRGMLRGILAEALYKLRSAASPRTAS
jgi:hypothetical protein